MGRARRAATIAPAMTAAKPRSIALAVAGSGLAASPEHRRFQTLLAKIEAARGRLAAWQRELPLFAQAHEQRVAPVRRELAVLRRQWAFELEQIVLGRRWAKADAASLQQMLCGLCATLIDDSDEADEEIEALYNRHAETDLATEEQQQLAEMKDLFERMSGVDLGEEPVASMDDLLRRAHDGMRPDRSDEGHEPPPRPARKPKKPSAAQLRAQEAEQRISQTVREVYRKLASALHPDRLDAQADAAQRAANTARMQRVNAAYEAGDLLAMLQLQLEIEQVDAAHVAGIAAAQVKHFNKVLAEQLRELEAEIDACQGMLCQRYGLRTSKRLDPQRLDALLSDELRELAAAKWRIAHDRRTLSSSPAMAQRFLKQWRAERRLIEQMHDAIFF